MRSTRQLRQKGLTRIAILLDLPDQFSNLPSLHHSRRLRKSVRSTGNCHLHLALATGSDATVEFDAVCRPVGQCVNRNANLLCPINANSVQSTQITTIISVNTRQIQYTKQHGAVKAKWTALLRFSLCTCIKLYNLSMVSKTHNRVHTYYVTNHSCPLLDVMHMQCYAVMYTGWRLALKR